MKEDEKSIPWHDKYAQGFCRSTLKGDKRSIDELQKTRDNAGGFGWPYVNLMSGETVVIEPTDRIIVKGKKVIRIIKKK